MVTYDLRALGVSVAPWVGSGYGSQAGKLWPYLQASGIDTAVYAYRGLIGKPVRWPDESGVLVLPQGRMSQFGWEVLPYFHEVHQPHFVMSLCNLFIFDQVKNLIAASGWPWYHWTPVDCSPLGAPDYHILNTTGIKPIAMSRFGQDQLRDWGFEDVPYIPHSIDCRDTFYPPSSEQRATSRHNLGIPEDAFVIGFNGANESVTDRKAIYQQLCAFASFRSRHSDALLYMHTVAYRHPVGLDIPSMLQRLEINDSVVFCDESRYNAGAISYTDLVEEFYWACDIGTHCSKGEGFGLPAVEFQACGVPVVATNCSTFPETVARGEYGGYLVPGQPEWSTLDSSSWLCPSTDDIEQAYELFYLEWKRTDLQARQIAARVHAVQFDDRRVQAEFWAPFLATLKERHAPKEPDAGFQPAVQFKESDAPSSPPQNTTGPEINGSSVGREAPLPGPQVTGP